MTKAEELQALLTKIHARKASDEEKARAKELRASITSEEIKAHALSQRK